MKYILVILTFFSVTLLQTVKADGDAVSIDTSQLHEIMNDVMKGDKVGRESGVYLLQSPQTLGDIVIRYVEVTKNGVYLATDQLPTKQTFVIAPIKINIEALNKASNISSLTRISQIRFTN